VRKTKSIITVFLVITSLIAGLFGSGAWLENEGSRTITEVIQLHPQGRWFEGDRANIIVDDDGGQDHQTIQAAIDNASTGDTIYVWAGTYNENVVVNTTVTLIGNGSADTIIDGGGSGDVVHVSANWVNVSGFNVTNSGDNWFTPYDSGIDIRSDNNNISNNLCSDNNNGIYLEGSDSNNITNNICSNNDFGITLFNSLNNRLYHNTCIDARIFLDHSNSNTLSNNTCNDNSAGLYLYYSDSNTLNNNTCNSNDDLGIDDLGILLEYSDGNILNNNTCNDNYFGILLHNCNSNTLYGNSMQSCGIYKRWYDRKLEYT